MKRQPFRDAGKIFFIGGRAQMRGKGHMQGTPFVIRDHVVNNVSGKTVFEPDRFAVSCCDQDIDVVQTLIGSSVRRPRHHFFQNGRVYLVTMHGGRKNDVQLVRR